RVRIRLMSPAPSLEPGDAIRLRANLAPPSMPAMPGGYDFARAAWFAGLGAVGYAFDQPQRRTDADLAEVPRSLQVSAITQRLRQFIGQRIAAALPGEEG